MKRFILALLLFATACQAQAEDLILRGLEKGKVYTLEVAADGSVTLTPATIKTVGPGAPIPNPPPGPNPPPAPVTPLEKEVQVQTKAVLDAGGTKTTGAALSTVYSLVGDKVEDGSIPTNQALPAILAATNLVMGQAADKDKWVVWRTAMSAALTKLQQEGSLTTKAQYVATFKQIATGLNGATGFSIAPASLLDSPRTVKELGILGGIDIQKIMDLIKLILDLLKLFGG